MNTYRAEGDDMRWCYRMNKCRNYNNGTLSVRDYYKYKFNRRKGIQYYLSTCRACLSTSGKARNQGGPYNDDPTLPVFDPAKASAVQQALCRKWGVQ